MPRAVNREAHSHLPEVQQPAPVERTRAVVARLLRGVPQCQPSPGQRGPARYRVAMSWADSAQAILDAMEASGVEVSRKVIGPGSLIGRKCSQFSVLAGSPGTLPFQRGTLPGGHGGACATVAAVTFSAIYTADCFPPPGDQGEQYPDTEMTTRTLQFLADCEAVWNALVDAAATFGEGCESVSIGQGQFAGPSGGLASMTVPITVQPVAPLDVPPPAPPGY